MLVKEKKLRQSLMLIIATIAIITTITTIIKTMPIKVTTAAIKI